MILQSKGHEIELRGSEPSTTNNRMELTGAARGPARAKKPCRVHVLCDSTYVVRPHTEGWLERWRRQRLAQGRQEAGREP